MVPWLVENDSFPHVEKALREPNGLLAAGGDLTPERLLDAYARGIFPWFNDDSPILWWSPDPRMVLFPSELKISRSLQKNIKNMQYEIRVDSAFREVMAACAAPRVEQPGTWITARMQDAYARLHELGFAHSVETWMKGKLVGGLYGVSLGKIFFGESMFSQGNNASKLSFVYLVAQLRRWQFGLIDCQMNTSHLASLGAREIPRVEFTKTLTNLINYSYSAQRWQFDDESVIRATLL